MNMDANTMANVVLGILAGLLLLAAWIDIRSNHIPNWLVLIGILLGLLFNIFLPSGFGFNSAMPGGLGWKASLGGMATGLIVMLPIYLIRAMGAGDVKLMAMVGAFLGATQILGVVVTTFLVGGVMALAMAVRLKMVRQVAHNMKTMAYIGVAKASIGEMPDARDATRTTGRMPYGVAIALGSLIYLVWHRLM